MNSDHSSCKIYSPQLVVFYSANILFGDDQMKPKCWFLTTSPDITGKNCDNFGGWYVLGRITYITLFFYLLMKDLITFELQQIVTLVKQKNFTLI